MKHTLQLAFAALALLTLTACESEKVTVLKSPCAGAEGSPCGPKTLPSRERAGVISNSL